MILADYHMHSSFSSDSESSMEEMIKSAADKGLKYICFTEHQDHGYPKNTDYKDGDFSLNIDSYLYDLLCMREKYGNSIQIGFGIELGMQEQFLRETNITAASQMFDFIIGSIHVVNGIDTYYPEFFEGKSDKEAIEEFFAAEIANIKKFKNFDVLGHMNYIVRTVPGGEASYKYSDFSDYIDEILKYLIENGKGIEVNTSALYKGFAQPNPDFDTIRRYKELGGEIITIGSDAHSPEAVAASFDKAEKLLKDAGFKYYGVFTRRSCEFERL